MKLFVVLAALAALMLAGCSGGDPTVPEQDEQGRYVIHMTAANRFVPAEAKVPAGATVLWVNDASVHDVTAHDGSFESPRNMREGQSFEHKFEAAGSVDYHCDLHASAGMKGTIHVEG